MKSRSTSGHTTRVPADVLVLIVAAFAVAVGYGLVSPVLPEYARSFDVSFFAASAVVSVFAFFRLVFAPVGGALVDKLGERWVYMTGLLVVALSMLACGVAQSYWQLLVLRGIGGIGSTLFTISAMALLTQLADPSARGRVMGLYATAFLVGNICGPVIGGVLGRFGMRVPFFVYAATLLVATAVVAVFLRGGRRRIPVSGEAPQEPLRVSEVLKDSSFRAVLVSNFANGFSSFGVRVAVVPLFAAAVFGNGIEAAGLALGSFAVGTALVVSVSGRLSDRFGRRPLVLAGLVVAGTSTIAIGWATSIPLLVVASAAAGLGAGIVTPAQQAAVADIVGPDRLGGKVMAAVQMASDFGAILGPIVVGFVVDVFGFVPGFAVAGSLLLLAVFPWLRSSETLPRAVELPRAH